MLKNIPTEIEIIYNPKLKKQAMIEIPKTNYYIHGLYTKEGNWEISIINPTQGYKRKISKDVKPSDFSKFVAVILAHPEQNQFKKPPRITKLRLQFKSIIKGFKA